MIIEIRHTLTVIVKEDSENWDDFKGQTPEDLFNHVTKYISEDSAYVFDDLLEKGHLSSELVIGVNNQNQGE